MIYALEFTPAARRDMKRLDRTARRRIDAVLGLLRENPRPPNAKVLNGPLREYWRVRTGDYRIIYTIEDNRLAVCVIRIGHRTEVDRD